MKLAMAGRKNESKDGLCIHDIASKAGLCLTFLVGQKMESEALSHNQL